MSARKLFPRGSSGGELCPGTRVIVHGIRSVKEMNGKEGTCIDWVPEEGRVHVQLDAGVKALRPKNLKVVRPKQPTNEMLDRVLEVFGSRNGDGVLDINEFARCLAGIGLGKEYVMAFQLAMDKDHDFEIDYAEFTQWALGADMPGRRTRLDLYWPKKRELPIEPVDEDDTVPDYDEELTERDIVKLMHRPLPDDWPTHGINIVNNARARFPYYPIVWSMKRNGYIGGIVLADIRSTGAKEVHPCRTTPLRACSEPFPAVYRNISPEGEMLVYEETRESGFGAMRDGKVPPIGVIPSGDLFTVYEARQGAEYGFCFGRIKFQGQESPPTWVVLGLLVEKGRRWMKPDEERFPKDLTFSDAERMHGMQ
ncbi:unnamed protein product [Effrenium voratum]|uniref:EF-hand domain-containing protein n=1 Tax=Effrenium voratum TaxID=2562239 RepID=A0AA36MS58_9DINO|nr:unnamed protein product [Effrenium voratum]CAJ1456117.1 unnamed protein product [Effrenium voratum]